MAVTISESQSRSLVKSITFRVLIVFADGIIVYLITHKLDLALTIVVVRNVVAMLLYYFHERFWDGITWGRRKRKI